jgi:hypothetical protein
MSDVAKYFNGVTFDAGDVEIPLTLDTDWIITAGDRPNINVATCLASDFNRLSTWTGSINFYFTSDPNGDDDDGDGGDPDVTLLGITVVDVQVGRVGILKGNDSTQIVDFKVSFADVRHQLVPPRGGVLILGDVNQEPFTGPVQNGAPTLVSNTELIHDCLEATGQDYELGDGDFDSFPPMRKLQWFGARAPEELSKLLQWIGGVLYVTSDGSLGVDLLGSGQGAPEIDPDDMLANVQLPVIDRRGKTVVFISAPTAAQMVYDSTSNAGNSDSPPNWDFVARDTDGSWQTLDNNSILSGLDPEEEIANGFSDVPDQYVAQLESDVYHCIQLDTDDYDPLYASLLKQVARSDGFMDDISATATIARRNSQDGSWANTTQDVNLQVTHVYGGVNVLRFADRLGKVSPSPTLDPDGNFQAIQANDITINFATEAAADTGNGKGYFACGFSSANLGDGSLGDTFGGGGPQPLAQDQVTSALQGGDDIVVLHSPALRLRRVNGQKTPDGDNFQDLQDQCQQLAAQVLAGSGAPPQMIVARGFYEAELSGVVSEIRYSQKDATTTIRVNSWFAPATAYQVDPGVARQLATARTLAGGGQPTGEAHPNQAVTLPSRTALGESGASQPLHTVGATAPAIPQRYDVAVQITDTEAGTGIYDCKYTDVPLSPSVSSGVSIQFANDAASQGIAVNIAENGGGVAGSHAIPLETVLFGTRGPVDPTTNKTIVWLDYDPKAYRSFQYIADPSGSGNMLFQGSTKLQIAATDPSWLTLLTFEACPTD